MVAAGAATDARDGHARHFLARAAELFQQTTGPQDWEALAALELETRNVSAAGRWLLANGRITPLLDFFAGLPLLDPFSFPVNALDDLGSVAGR